MNLTFPGRDFAAHQRASLDAILCHADGEAHMTEMSDA